MMTAKEAKVLSDANRESYIAGLTSHYLEEISSVIKHAASIGKNSIYTVVPPVHYSDVLRHLTKTLRTLGYKVTTEKKHHKINISWDEEEDNGLSESTQENS